MGESIIKVKSFELAVLGVGLYKDLISNKEEFVMSKQFLRSVTSVGANIREAVNAQSRTDFINKLSIAQKECGESMYWLELLKETQYINYKDFNGIHTNIMNA